MQKLNIALAAALLLAACATSETTPAAPAPTPPPVVHPTTPERNPAVQVDAGIFIPPPPAANGAQELAERAIVRGPWTPERRQQALDDNAIDPFAAFDSVLGPGFTQANFPATYAVLDRAGRAAGFAGDPVKFIHRRPRPFLSDEAITPCIPNDERLRASFSYPSGHAALGFAWALVPRRTRPVSRRGTDRPRTRLHMEPRRLRRALSE